jgi:hypothetical protein
MPEEIIKQHTGQYIENEEAILADCEPLSEVILSISEARQTVQTLL